MRRKFGWLRDFPDHRDHLFTIAAPIKLPPSVDLRPNMPPIYDQEDLGSCTANAIAAAYEYDLGIEQKFAFMPSRLFIYYNERKIERTIAYDSGAQIRDGIKSIASQGVCPETDWPYVIPNFAKEPYETCYVFAKEHTAIRYARVPIDLNQIKQVLASGYPIIFGFTVFNSFESAVVAKTGMVGMPLSYDSVLGGHAVLAVGYDDVTERITVRNSWGEDWGDRGYCYFPYEYFNSRLVADLWTVKTVL